MLNKLLKFYNFTSSITHEKLKTIARGKLMSNISIVFKFNSYNMLIRVSSSSVSPSSILCNQVFLFIPHGVCDDGGVVYGGVCDVGGGACDVGGGVRDVGGGVCDDGGGVCENGVRTGV